MSADYSRGEKGDGIPWPWRIAIFPSVPSLSTAVVAYPPDPPI